MKRYSQNFEQDVILNYFGDFKGNLLSIGENDGLHLSNCLALIERGWSAVLVEPSKSAFYQMWTRHGFNNNPKVWCFNVAISNFNGEADFYESGEHLGVGDTALLSTLNKSELKRWEGSKNTFTETKCLVWDYAELQRQAAKSGMNTKYDFINIDCEGEELKIMPQIDFSFTKLVCVEWNSKDEKKYNDIMFPFGFRLVSKNPENLIYTIFK